MAIEEQCRVLDEHRVGIVRKLGQADHFEACIRQRLLIGRVLRDCPGDVDRRAIQMGERAVGQPRADRAR